MKTISFFGHSQIFNKNSVKEKLMNKLRELIPQGFSRLLMGCHGNFDGISLSTCLDYKKQFNDTIEINVVLTSFSFLKKDEYGNSQVDFYKEKGCDTIFYDIEEIFYKNRITYSNKKMVDDSDLIICYVDMNSYRSGAKTAVKYALRQNKKVINLYDKEDRLKKSY